MTELRGADPGFHLKTGAALQGKAVQLSFGVVPHRALEERRKNADGEALVPADDGLKFHISPGRRGKTARGRLQVVAPFNAYPRVAKVGARELASQVVEAVVETLVARGDGALHRQLMPMNREAEIVGPHEHELAARGHMQVMHPSVVRRCPMSAQAEHQDGTEQPFPQPFPVKHRPHESTSTTMWSRSRALPRKAATARSTWPRSVSR